MTSLICVLPCTYGLTVNTPTYKSHPKSTNNQDKRSLLIGDLSYSYSATDIGSDKGSHVKTITVIKNIGAPKFHKHHPHHPYDEWDSNSKNRFNFVFKFPEFPQIDTGTFFQTEKPRKVIPTKQPTDRHIPVFNTEFDTNNFDDQPNVNLNTNTNNVPPVSENSPEALPDPMTMVNTETPITKEASDEVEYIQTDGEQSKSTMPTPAMFHSKKVQSSRASTSHGYRTTNVHEETSEHKQLQGHRQSSDFIEDFSDYSMHNVRHLVDPMKVKDSLLKYTQNQSNLDLKKLTKIDPTVKDQKYDSYGNVIRKSQSLLDQSSSYRDNSESNTQASKRPYISPSLKKAYNSPSPSPPTIASTTSSKALTFFSTTQKAYVAPKKLKASENVNLNPDKSFIKPSTELIQQPMYSLQLNNGNHELSDQMLKFEFQPEQQKENYNSPLKQLNEEKKAQQQFHSHSIRNPLTTSLPVQHNRKEPLKFQPKLQSYVAVPIDADLPSTYFKDGSKPHLLTMPKRYVRHHIVFDSKPPHAFMESPFQPVKAILMG